MSIGPLAGLASAFTGGLVDGGRAALGGAVAPPAPPLDPGTAGSPPGAGLFPGLTAPFTSFGARPPLDLSSLLPQPPLQPPAPPLRDRLDIPLRPFPFPFPFPVPQPVSKTATELARSAVVLLGDAAKDVLQDALNTLSIKTVKAADLLSFLERKVRVGEVLNQLARTWTDTTGGDFADAFQMDRAKTDVMDALVSIAILNNPQLDEEILAENLPQTALQDLVDNRVIVDQWPKGGTALNPPYLILVAVEYRDIASAEDVVRSIIGGLVDFQGTKLPQAAVQRLQG